MKDLFNAKDGFISLSIKDLLDARDLYHYHLMNKKNVVATAIGYYRIRKSDIWPSQANPDPDNSKNKSIARTLDNSEVRPYSWPAVLVFVDDWETERALAQENPSDVVPKTLFLPDSRKVPVCVIEAKRIMNVEDSVDETKLVFPRNLISGGFPVMSYTQQRKRIASIGCLVTDGHLTFALTASHVTGKGGEPVYSKLGEREKQIGHGGGKCLERVKFSDVYSEWPSRNTYLNMDIGLIEVDDLNEWKTEVFKIGALGRMADLGQGNFSLSLVGQPVSAFGSVSGEITGEIKALFYRFKALGGFEYVSDFLIGSRDDTPLNIHAGDSGSVVLYERPTEDGNAIAERMPIAMLWGQHVYGDAQKNKSPYALATCLSTACNLLGVDLVRGWNTDMPYIWGKSGHYTVGNFAIEFIKDKKFRDLMRKNVTNISFKVDDIVPDWDAKDKATKEKYKKLFAEFCPLADVPDIIWKQSPKKTSFGRQGAENPNHYMDADIPCTSYPNGASYLEYATDKSKITVQELLDYYANLDLEKVSMKKAPNKGLVPLRVWQIFSYMVAAVKKRKIHQYIFGAGVLAHYIGDSCQPLHSSYFANGDPADDTVIDHTAQRDSPATSKHPHKKGDVYKIDFNIGNGVHAAYEDAMIDDNRDAIMEGLQAIVDNLVNEPVGGPSSPIDDGQAAGYAVVELMRETHLNLEPGDIVKAYKKYKKANKNDRMSELLWEDFGQQTIECIARGCAYQAAIWEAAWELGGGKVADYSDEDFDSDTFKKSLKKLYENPEELKSYYLDQIGDAGVLK